MTDIDSHLNYFFRKAIADIGQHVDHEIVARLKEIAPDFREEDLPVWAKRLTIVKQDGVEQKRIYLDFGKEGEQLLMEYKDILNSSVVDGLWTLSYE